MLLGGSVIKLLLDWITWIPSFFFFLKKKCEPFIVIVMLIDVDFVIGLVGTVYQSISKTGELWYVDEFYLVGVAFDKVKSLFIYF